MPQMRALLIESPPDVPAGWLQELADEFIEDPQCRLALFGGDATGALLFSLWDPDVVDEVAEGLRATVPTGAVVRSISLADAGVDGPPAGETMRQ